MRPFQLFMWVMRRRMRQSWGLSVVTSLGILGAVVLLSTTALYSQVLAETGVRHALFSESSSGLHVQVLSENRPLGPEDYAQLRGITENAIEHRIGSLSTRVERFGRAQAGMSLTTNSERRPPLLGSPSGRPFFMTGFPEHSQLVEGIWPRTPGEVGPGGVQLEAVVGQRAANDMGFEVGDWLYITPFRSSPEERIELHIVGVVTPIDSRDEYWMGTPNQFSLQTVGEILVVPAFVAEEDFLQVLGRRFPTAVGEFGFNIFVDPSVITADTVDATQEALESLETDLNKSYPRTFVFSRLGLTLNDFERDLTLARVPVYVFVSLVVIVVLYFLVLITGILGRSQAEELGLLRSRGSSVIQVCGVLLLADSVLALAAIAFGPLLAWPIVRYLMLPTFGELGGGPIETSLSANMYWMGAIGAVLALAALAVSATLRARAGISDSMATRSRPAEVSFLHRYYLDIVVVLVVGLLWWQFGEREGFLSKSLATRGLEVDPTVILGPVMGLLAAALLLMRVLPLVVRMVVWLCVRGGPAWSSFATTRLARDSVLPSSLAVLLMLSTALGVFGATFQSSLSKSQREQTSYRVGGEVVVSGPGVRPALAEELGRVPGVIAATPVLRDSISLVEGHAIVPAVLLAADPQVISQSAWFRADFADTTLHELTARMRNAPPEKPPGVPLPAGVGRIGVWLDSSDLGGRELQDDINVWAKIADAEGRYRNVSLGGFAGPADSGGQGWRFLAGDLSERIVLLDREWSLAAIFFTISSYVKVTAGNIHLDDLTAFGPALPGEGVVVEDFESQGRWSPLGIGEGSPDSVEWGSVGARSGSGGLTFSWVEPFSGEPRGAHISPVTLPLPAIGGAGLRPGQELRIRHGRGAIRIRVVAESDLFPTITNLRRPFVILDIDDYLSYLRILPPTGLRASAKEFWLSLDSSYDRQSVLADITDGLPPFTSVVDRNAAAERAAVNPLAGGGWDGLTGLSMAAIGLAVITALLLHSAASARSGRVDTAVARALGLSTRQLLLSLTLEKWLMGGVAIAAGAAIGYWPGLELVQMLELTPTDSVPIPPLIPEVHGMMLGLVLAGLTAAVMASAVYAAVLARRDRPAEVLRQGS